MSIGAIGGIQAATQAGTGRNRFAEMSSEDFIRVMMAELANQDPLAPQDSAALLDQFASLRNIESQLTLQDSLRSLVLQNQVATASGMIGKTVEGLDSQNNRVTGSVLSIRVVEQRALLELSSGHTLSLDRVSRVADPGF